MLRVFFRRIVNDLHIDTNFLSSSRNRVCTACREIELRISSCRYCHVLCRSCGQLEFDNHLVRCVICFAQTASSLARRFDYSYRWRYLLLASITDFVVSIVALPHAIVLIEWIASPSPCRVRRQRFRASYASGICGPRAILTTILPRSTFVR